MTFTIMIYINYLILYKLIQIFTIKVKTIWGNNYFISFFPYLIFFFFYICIQLLLLQIIEIIVNTHT